MRNPRSLAALGVSIGITALALVAFQPSATLAGASGVSLAHQTGSAGRTAAQVGSRLLIDSLSDPVPSAGSHSRSASDGSDYRTIALASLHPSAQVGHPGKARASSAGTPATTVPIPAPVTAPPTTTAAPVATPAPSPAPAPPPAPATPPAPTAPGAPVAPTPGVWAELRECESGDNYTIDTGNGYYGAYQFSLATWQGLGYPGFPNQAPPAVQDQAAEQLQARSGWGQWPECSAKLGL